MQKILNSHFDKVRFSISGKIDIEELIDKLEAEEPEGISIEYPADYSTVTISPDDTNWSIYIEKSSVSIVNHYLESPVNMLLCFNESRNLISSDENLRPLLE